MRFTIEEPFWSLFPQARIAAVVIRGLDNRRGGEAAAVALAAEAERTVARLGDAEIGALPSILPWRAAYQAFGVKPSKFRSSIESLLRAAKAGRLGSINPLVDLYNAVSLRFELPCGGEDLAALEGDLRLTRAVGDELFVPLGRDEPEPPRAGAVIYRDDAGVICSCWNWREADRTKLTEATTDAFLCLEALPPSTAGELRQAAEDLAARVTAGLGGTARVEILDRARPTLDLK